MWRWLAARPWATSLILVAIVTGGGAAALTYANSVQDARQRCIERWADELEKVVNGSRDLWLDVAVQIRERTQDRDRFETLLNRYETAVGNAQTAKLRC